MLWGQAWLETAPWWAAVTAVNTERSENWKKCFVEPVKIPRHMKLVFEGRSPPRLSRVEPEKYRVMILFKTPATPDRYVMGKQASVCWGIGSVFWLLVAGFGDETVRMLRIMLGQELNGHWGWKKERPSVVLTFPWLWGNWTMWAASWILWILGYSDAPSEAAWALISQGDSPHWALVVRGVWMEECNSGQNIVGWLDTSGPASLASWGPWDGDWVCG